MPRRALALLLVLLLLAAIFARPHEDDPRKPDQPNIQLCEFRKGHSKSIAFNGKPIKALGEGDWTIYKSSILTIGFKLQLADDSRTGLFVTRWWATVGDHQLKSHDDFVNVDGQDYSSLFNHKPLNLGTYVKLQLNGDGNVVLSAKGQSAVFVRHWFTGTWDVSVRTTLSLDSVKGICNKAVVAQKKKKIEDQPHLRGHTKHHRSHGGHTKHRNRRSGSKKSKKQLKKKQSRKSSTAAAGKKKSKKSSASTVVPEKKKKPVVPVKVSFKPTVAAKPSMADLKQEAQFAKSIMYSNCPDKEKHEDFCRKTTSTELHFQECLQDRCAFARKGTHPTTKKKGGER